MNKSKKSRVKYYLFHSVFSIILLLLSIIGVKLLNIFLYPIGAAVILLGVLSFFPSIIVKTGIYDSLGNEYVATNLFERIGVLVGTVLIGGAIMILPQLLELPSYLGFVSIVVFASVIGLKIGSENRKYHYIDESKKYIGQFVPLTYIAAGAVYLVESIFDVGAWLTILAMALAFAFHAFRVVIFDLSCDY